MEDYKPTPLPQINPVIKALSHIIILMGLYFMFTVLFSAIGTYIATLITGIPVKPFADDMLAELADASKINTYKIYFLVSSLGSFTCTALVFAKFFARADIKVYFGFRGVLPPVKQLLWILLIAVCAIPLISYLSVLSKNLPLPPDVAQDALKIQDTYNTINGIFLNTNSAWVLLFNLLVMAITPAIGEELLFRGAFMQTFYRLFGGRIHIAVFVVAFLFSAVHLQVYNFLAILLMGVIFGYLYYWSGNIMVTIWAHFLNNAIAVFFSYLYIQNPDLEIFSDNYDFGPVSALVSGLLLTIGVIGFYRATRPYHVENE